MALLLVSDIQLKMHLILLVLRGQMFIIHRMPLIGKHMSIRIINSDILPRAPLTDHTVLSEKVETYKCWVTMLRRIKIFCL